MGRRRLYLYAGGGLLFCALNFGLYMRARPFHRAPVENPEELSPVSADPEGIRKALAQIQDPEIGISIVDLGLVRNIEVRPDHKALITIIFTTPGCPLMDSIVSEIEQRVKEINGIEEVEVRIDSSVAWNRTMMTGNGQRTLKERSK